MDNVGQIVRAGGLAVFQVTADFLARLALVLEIITETEYEKVL